MAPFSPAQTPPHPEQLLLPLAPPQLAARSPGAPTAPERVWTSLSPAEQGECRQTLVAVLREVVHDATE